MAATEQPSRKVSREPTRDLALLISEHLGVTVSTERLRQFIWDHFDEISPLAHQIHETSRRV